MLFTVIVFTSNGRERYAESRSLETATQFMIEALKENPGCRVVIE